MIDTLLQLHNSYLARVEAGEERGLSTQQAKSIACDKDAQELFEMLPSIVAALDGIYKERNWLLTFIHDHMDCDHCPYQLDCLDDAPINCDMKILTEMNKETGE